MKSARKSAETQPPIPTPLLTINVAPLLAVVRRHVKLSPEATRRLAGDFARMFEAPGVHAQAATPSTRTKSDAVLTTQEAADLVGVSRPYIVARVEAGDIALYQQVGNQRRVLRSDVLAWHHREQARRRRALGRLGADLDDEMLAG